MSLCPYTVCLATPWSSCLLYCLNNTDVISLSHCGGILAHSSLQYFFSSLRFAGKPFQSCWGLDYELAIVAWPNFLKALADRWPHMWLQNTLVHGQLNNCKVPRSYGCKTSQKSSLLYPPVLCLIFFQMWSCVLWTNISTLVLSVKRTLFQKYYWFTCSFADLTNTSIFFLERRGRQEAIVWLLFQTSHTCLVFFYFILLLTEARSLRCNIWIFFSVHSCEGCCIMLIYTGMFQTSNLPNPQLL